MRVVLVTSKQSGVVTEPQPWHCYFHPSGENRRTSPKTHQNMLFSHIDKAPPQKSW